MTSFLHYIVRIPSFSVSNTRMPKADDVLVKFMKQSNFSGLVDIRYKERSSKSFKLWEGVNLRLKFNTYQDHYGVTQQRLRVDFPMDGEGNNNHFPHKKFMDRIKRFVQQLKIGSGFDRKQDYRAKKKPQRLEDDRNGLGKILPCFTSLKKLSLDSLEFPILLGNFTGTSKSLETLEISRTAFHPKILIGFSERLPALKHLHVTKLYTCSEPAPPVTIQIHMMHNTLDTIYCHWHYHRVEITDSFYILDDPPEKRQKEKNYWEFYMKLVTNTRGEEYFFGDGYKLIKSTKQEYEESLENHRLMSIDIQCKDLKMFWFKLDGPVERMERDLIQSHYGAIDLPKSGVVK